MADKPVTREEKYLAYLTGDYTGEIPKPITRKEKYLYELCLKGIGGEISPEEIQKAVNEYLEKNPVKPGATTEQAQQIEQNKTDIGSLKTETGSLKEDLVDLNDILKVIKKVEVSTDSSYSKFNIDLDGFDLKAGKLYKIVVDNESVSDTHFDVHPNSYNNSKICTIQKGTTHSEVEFAPKEDVTKIILLCPNRHFTNFKGCVTSMLVVDSYADTVKKIEDIETNIDVLKEIPNYNLFDLDNMTLECGYINKTDGQVLPSATVLHTDFIKVEPNTKYYVNGIYLKDLYAYYNENKGFVSGMTIENGEFTTGENIHYVRFSSIDVSVNKNTWYLTKYENHFYPNGLYLPKLSRFLGKNTLIIGDSISTGTKSYQDGRGQSYGEYDKWVDILLNEKFFSYDNLLNDSIHATGFVRKLAVADGGMWLNGENNFVQRLQYYIDNDKCSAFDEMILFGGINDFISNVPLQDYKNAVDTFFSNLMDNFTHARILVILPLQINYQTNGIGVTFDEYFEYLKDVCKSYCIPCFDASYCSGFNPKNNAFKEMWCFNSDGVHPNNEYQKKFLAPMIKGFIEQY